MARVDTKRREREHGQTRPSKRSKLRKSLTTEMIREMLEEPNDTEPSCLHALEKISSSPVILSRIFLHLAPCDIKTACLVSTTWRAVLELPKFWTWATARLTDLDFEEKSYSRRFRNLSHVIFECKSEEHQLTFFQGVAATQLSHLSVRGGLLGKVKPQVLADVLVKLTKVDLHEFSLTSDQVSSLFRTLADEEDVRLGSLHLCCNEVSSVTASDLVRAVKRLEAVHLTLYSYNKQQVELVFHGFVKAEHKDLVLFLPEPFDDLDHDVMLPRILFKDKQKCVVIVTVPSNFGAESEDSEDSENCEEFEYVFEDYF